VKVGLVKELRQKGEAYLEIHTDQHNYSKEFRLLRRDISIIGIRYLYCSIVLFILVKSETTKMDLQLQNS